MQNIYDIGYKCKKEKIKREETLEEGDFKIYAYVNM